MARERSIVVRLKAEISDYQNKIGAASRSLSEFEKAQQSMGGASTTTMGRLVQSARVNQQEWSTVGRTLAVTGGAIAGIGVAALKTGISYNTLQQTSRAALTTIMGGAEGANRQMDKLDEFARSSPFAKQVFIQAQQQMLGFGIEAKKVIPYLGSIQDSVAAVGGSNQDIEELAYIFSKVSAAGKITAVDLMQFGKRGLDAAELIGSQMGKTGAQIRDDITAGALDAGVALDALAAGMDERFGGAAANVKETFSGAVDRVKAAWRDLSAALAEPLVGKEGGGLAVAGLNKLADAMRAFEGAPGWVKGGVVAIGALTSATALAGGSFMVALPRIVEYQQALRTLTNAHPALGRFATGLGRVARVAGIAGAALGGLMIAGQINRSLQEGRRDVQGLELALRGLDDAALEVAGSGDAAAVALDRIQNPTMGDWVTDTLFGWAGLSSQSQNMKDDFAALGDAFASLYASDPDLAGERFQQMLEATGYTTEELMDLMPGYALALERAADGSDEAADAVDEFGNAVDGATGSVEDQINKLWELTQAHLDSANAVLGHRDAERRWYETLDRASAALEDNGKNLDITTEKGRTNQAALDDIASSGWALIEQMKEQGATNTDLQNSMENVRSKFVDTATAFGMARDDAERLADQLGLIPSNVHTDVSVDTYGAQQTVDQFIRDNNGRQIRITTLNTVQTTGQPAGWQSGSMGQYGQFNGGWIAPGLRDGGFVPGPRAGYDNVAWPLYAGGRVMTQPLEGGEFVVRSSIASQYPQFLTDLNAGKYSGGVRNGGFAASSAGITINLHGVPMDQAAEVANAVSFEMRRANRGGVHNRRGA